MATFLSLSAGLVETATRNKIKELALEVSESYSLLRVKPTIQRISTLLRYLRVLQEDETITKEERTAIYMVLIKVGELYHIPTAPTVTANRIVNILFGQQGVDGQPGPAGPPGTGFPYFNTPDASLPVEIIDTVALGDCNGCRWDYYCIGGIGAGRRVGSIMAVWDDTDVSYYQHKSEDLGGSTSDLVFSVDIAGGFVRLLASVATNNWIIKGARYQMQDDII
jgi:hypothetical protein